MHAPATSTPIARIRAGWQVVSVAAHRRLR